MSKMSNSQYLNEFYFDQEMSETISRNDMLKKILAIQEIMGEKKYNKYQLEELYTNEQLRGILGNLKKDLEKYKTYKDNESLKR